jgi:hypothetical protein
MAASKDLRIDDVLYRGRAEDRAVMRDLAGARCIMAELP